jgi:hypothetical protein
MLAFAAGAFGICTAIERSARVAFPAAIPPEKGGLTGSSGKSAAAAAAAARRKED